MNATSDYAEVVNALARIGREVDAGNIERAAIKFTREGDATMLRRTIETGWMIYKAHDSGTHGRAGC